MKERSIRAQVKTITPLTDSVLQVVLTPEHFLPYQAGQYLQILFNHEAFSYSIANAPLGAHQYELHIRHSLDNPYNQLLFKHIKETGFVQIKLPCGSCHMQSLNKDKPIIFIAGGTGFAPIKAMIEQLLADADPRPFELFWSARSKSDLYLDEQVTTWNAHVAHFSYFSLFADERNETLASAVLTKHPKDLKEWQIVISGPFDMVYSTRDVLISHGVSPDQLFSDAFSFEVKGES